MKNKIRCNKLSIEGRFSKELKNRYTTLFVSIFYKDAMLQIFFNKYRFITFYGDCL